MRLNFTFESYFTTFPLLWDVCGRTSQLDLDFLSIPTAGDPEITISFFLTLRVIVPTAPRLEFSDNFGNFRQSFYDCLYKIWAPQNNKVINALLLTLLIDSHEQGPISQNFRKAICETESSCFKKSDLSMFSSPHKT